LIEDPKLTFSDRQRAYFFLVSFHRKQTWIDLNRQDAKDASGKTGNLKLESLKNECRKLNSGVRR